MSFPEGFQAEFTYSEAQGLGPQSGITRRDPSCVIRVGDSYHVWYTKTDRCASGYDATVWHASSPDGHEWTERDEALPRGTVGSWDEHSVFTPNILVAAGMYYLFYTAVPEPFTNDDGGPAGTPTAIGVAVSESPDGPWTRHDAKPVLTTGRPGAFDSHRVDDSCLLVRGGKYWMYYKGRELGLTPGETKMGLAVADAPTGPYVKHELNPIVSCGHEVLVWPHGSGVASLAAIGPPSLWWAADGIRFEMVCEVADRPSAPGAFRPDAFDAPAHGVGIAWGLCQHQSAGQWPCLRRFDCNLSAE